MSWIELDLLDCVWDGSRQSIFKFSLENADNVELLADFSSDPGRNSS